MQRRGEAKESTVRFAFRTVAGTAHNSPATKLQRSNGLERLKRALNVFTRAVESHRAKNATRLTLLASRSKLQRSPSRSAPPRQLLKKRGFDRKKTTRVAGNFLGRHGLQRRTSAARQLQRSGHVSPQEPGRGAAAAPSDDPAA